MIWSRQTKPDDRAGVRPPDPKAAPGKDAASASRDAAGRVVHDERGNAVWNWIKEAGRTAIESTSVLLKKLEAPELKMEDSKDEELRLEDADPGGGYDPYNQKTPVRKSPTARPPRK